jgi:predicted HNH restriction endonuclease
MGLYCSNKCQQQKRYVDYIDRWMKGDEKGCGGKTADLSHYIYRYLHETRGTACEVCSWDIKHPVDGRTLTEVDHVDGDAHNCKIENLKILCPNFHAMTPTFRARNVSSKRKR